MGVTTWRLGGAGAFVLFTGLSIIPRELTLGDCITRCIAAVYLRQRSRSFREWVDKIEGIHLLTWILRATLLSFACYGALRQGSEITTVITILAGAGLLAGILRLAESEEHTKKSDVYVAGTPGGKTKIIQDDRVVDTAPAAYDEKHESPPPVNRPEQWYSWNPHARRT
jgi:hypothetical protein